MCPVILCRHALFGFDPDELRVVPSVFLYILNVCKYIIWLARDDFRFRDTRPGALVVIGNVKARAKFHLPLFFKRFKSARRRRRRELRERQFIRRGGPKNGILT